MGTLFRESSCSTRVGDGGGGLHWGVVTLGYLLEGYQCGSVFTVWFERHRLRWGGSSCAMRGQGVDGFHCVGGGCTGEEVVVTLECLRGVAGYSGGRSAGVLLRGRLRRRVVLGHFPGMKGSRWSYSGPSGWVEAAGSWGWPSRSGGGAVPRFVTLLAPVYPSREGDGCLRSACSSL